MIFFSLLKNNFLFIRGLCFQETGPKFDVQNEEKTLDEYPTLTTQAEKNELSDEILKGFTHRELLSKTHNERLQYVTQERLHGNKLASGEVMSFTFKFFEQENSELYMQTTAGQVIPAEISKIQVNNILYTRIGTQGEFFAEDNNRLAIHDGTRIDVIEKKSSQDIENEIVNFESELAHEGIVKYETTEEGQEEVSKDFQVALEAKKRGIDISLALLLCDNQENIEHALTDVARIAGNYSLSMNLENAKHSDDLALKVLKDYFPADWKKKAEAYGVSLEVVEEYEKENEYVYKGEILFSEGEQGVLDMIAHAEGTDDNYNALYGKPKQSNLDFSQMSLNKILDYQRKYVNQGSPSSAIGRYQIIQKTLKQYIKTYNISGDTLFSKSFQDTFALRKLHERGLSDFKAGQIDGEQFQKRVSMEWASIPEDSGNKSYYHQDGLNKSHISTAQFQKQIETLS